MADTSFYCLRCGLPFEVGKGCGNLQCASSVGVTMDIVERLARGGLEFTSATPTEQVFADLAQIRILAQAALRDVLATMEAYSGTKTDGLLSSAEQNLRSILDMVGK